MRNTTPHHVATATLFVALGIVLLALSGCQNPTGADLDSRKANSDVSIRIYLSPSDITATATTYSASVYIETESTGSQSDYVDAIVTVNDTPLTYYGAPYEYFYLSSSGGPTLSAGDTVTVIIEHEDLGTIVETATVPNAAPGLSVSPSLPSSGTPIAPDGPTSYIASITTGAPDGTVRYFVGRYDATRTWLGVAYTSNPIDASAVLWDSGAVTDGTDPYPYLDFYVLYFSRDPINGFAETSRFEMTGSGGEIITNR